MKSKTASAPARPLQDIASGRKDCYCIEPTLIQSEEGFNERKDYGDLKALAADIEANGLLQPLRIHKEKGSENIFLIDGHRRHAAITTILIPEGRWPKDPKNPKKHAAVDCISAKPGTDEIDRLFMQLSMNSGKPLTFLEEAGLYQRILASDSTLKPADIARRASKTKQAISDSLRLVNEGSKEILAAVQKSTIAATTALQIIKQTNGDHTAQNTLLKTAQENAAQNNATHITPKHLPEKTEPSQSGQSSQKDQSNPSDQTNQSPTPPITPSLPPSFKLFAINNTPKTGDTDGYHYETDRLALTNPPAGIISLHLLNKLINGSFCFGYRINGTVQLPNFITPLSCLDIEDGYRQALDTALEAGKINLNETALDQLNQALYEVICEYYPEQGEGKEPEQLEFTEENKKSAYERITNAGTTNRDGTAPGTGEGKFSAPDKQLEKIEKLLDELDEKSDGFQDRIATTEILLDVIRNTRSIKDLRFHLTGK